MNLSPVYLILLTYLNGAVDARVGNVSTLYTSDEDSGKTYNGVHALSETRKRETYDIDEKVKKDDIPSKSKYDRVEETDHKRYHQTIRETQIDGVCIDSPIGWHDIGGPVYDCDWYASYDRCEKYGHNFENMGKVANEACCACGGGKPSPSPSPSPSTSSSESPSESPSDMPTPFDLTCIDSPIGWYDSDGPVYDCDWYASYDRCEKHGHNFENMGKVANEACCACGGGKPSPPPSETCPCFTAQHLDSISNENINKDYSCHEYQISKLHQSDSWLALQYAVTSRGEGTVCLIEGDMIMDVSEEEGNACRNLIMERCHELGFIGLSHTPSYTPSTSPSESPTTCFSLDDWAFKVNGQPGRGCGWVSNYPYDRCLMSTGAKEACKRTCCGIDVQISPSSVPSVVPTTSPSDRPSSVPTSMPSIVPSFTPSVIPSADPSSAPTVTPSSAPQEDSSDGNNNVNNNDFNLTISNNDNVNSNGNGNEISINISNQNNNGRRTI